MNCARIPQVGPSMTPCMPCSFDVVPRPRSGTCAQPNGLIEMTVSVRWIPLVPAPCGTRGGTADLDDDALQLLADDGFQLV